MSTDGTLIAITVLAFGPLAERLGGRHHHHEVGHNTTVRQLVVNLGLEEWIAFGLSVAVNGERCSMDKELLQGQEVALLPPVSGG
jgi:molybdopterin converting factor small subunit